MSLPLQNTNQPSSSPSKSSLRRPSGTGGSGKTSATNPSPGPVTHFASQATQHHFLPHSPPNQNLEYEEEEDEEALTYDGSYQTAPQPSIPLQPFFTLIEDTVTNEHYHPTVHYLFADDDPDIITEAACRSLEQNADPIITSRTDHTQEHGADDGDSYVNSRLPPLRPGIREHYLILDVAPVPGATDPASQLSDRLSSPSPGSVETAHALSRSYPYTITSAQSLSADWQVIRTNITDAPTMNADQQLPGEHHLMLRVEGRGNSPDKLLQRRENETTEHMIGRFQTRLAEIRNLMVELDVEEMEDVNAAEERELFGGYQPTGFGTAVLDEQD